MPQVIEQDIVTRGGDPSHKRYIARELFQALRADLAALNAHQPTA